MTALHFLDEGRLISSGMDQQVRIRDLESGKSRSVRINTVVTGLVPLAGSKEAALATWGMSGLIHDWERDGLVATLEGHTSGLSAVAASADGRLVLTASWDATARLWNARDTTEIRSFEGFAGSVNVAALAPDGGRACSRAETRRGSSTSLRAALPPPGRTLACGAGPSRRGARRRGGAPHDGGVVRLPGAWRTGPSNSSRTPAAPGPASPPSSWFAPTRRPAASTTAAASSGPPTLSTPTFASGMHRWDAVSVQ